MKFISYLLTFIACFGSLKAVFNENLLLPGHSVYMTKNPDDTTKWKFKLLQEAKTSIEMSAGYSGGLVLDQLLQILIFQLENNPNIHINLILFEVFDFITPEKKQLMDGLKSKYPGRFEYCVTYETGLINQEGKVYITENHTKMIIIDEKYFLLGGTNLLDQLSTGDVNKAPPPTTLAAKFLPKASSDMDIVASGPIAKKLRQDFFRLLALYQSGEELEQHRGEFLPSKTSYFSVKEEDKGFIEEFEHHPELATNAKIYGLIAGPRINLHAISDIYKHYIDKAQISINIGNMYFFPYKPLYEGLINAINRDVSLSLVTNGAHDELSTSNSTRTLYTYINRLNYLPMMTGKHYHMWEMFLAAGAKQKNTSIYELNAKGVLYHKKVMAVDHRYSIIGSYNLGMKSEDAAHEVVVIVDSPGAAKQIEAVLAKDKTQSKAISFDQTLAWYFNPYYNAAQAVEKKFLDGIVLKAPQDDFAYDDLEELGPAYPEVEGYFPFEM